MPTCPQCGGAEAKQLAPGYFECESTRDDEVCGHRYQEGPGSIGVNSPMCHCGTFAIGQCAECGIWVCGTHSSIRDEQRLCSEHYQAATDRWWAEEEERLRPIREESERRQQEAAEAGKKRVRQVRESAAAAVVIAPLVAWACAAMLGIAAILTSLIVGAAFGIAVENYRSQRDHGWTQFHLPTAGRCIWGGLWGSVLGLVVYLLD